MMVYVSSVLVAVAVAVILVTCLNGHRIVGRNLWRFNRVWVGRSLLFLRGLTAVLMLSSTQVALEGHAPVNALQFTPRSTLATMVVAGEASWVVYVMVGVVLMLCSADMIHVASLMSSALMTSPAYAFTNMTMLDVMARNRTMRTPLYEAFTLAKRLFVAGLEILQRATSRGGSCGQALIMEFQRMKDAVLIAAATAKLERATNEDIALDCANEATPGPAKTRIWAKASRSGNDSSRRRHVQSIEMLADAAFADVALLQPSMIQYGRRDDGAPWSSLPRRYSTRKTRRLTCLIGWC
ncbi:hypothetical protein H257_11275 [Aphanomyces astaci]|uniref:Uncharacterized protein n=1 Tax=Aphanomyces astaci TaxID=112090 RepID=W4G4T6_APHAT|nr:hypothetical protein H257_11275 [Aphanomyces astaci]ETV73958.1 hypothetical protein H257_11275 [Aphanomyces astaci]|eukprot:XP_009836471.1 hypothetical protein H257_11275 [Aphanomyces astaci]